MDPVLIGYYATVCALLSVGVGARMRWFARLIVGALVGVGAAAFLPAVRAALGL